MTDCSKTGFRQLASPLQTDSRFKSSRAAWDQAAPGRDEMRFFIYLLELYAAGRGTAADKVLKDWDRLCITDIILDRCACYRAESLENAFADIDSLRQKKTKGTALRPDENTDTAGLH